ncbi:MAG: hypothetical protein LUP91_16275, partial [Methylococcaceae bacterium]|nr:hypothetical protein [Methylococcaceae bacterium]
ASPPGTATTVPVAAQGQPAAMVPQAVTASNRPNGVGLGCPVRPNRAAEYRPGPVQHGHPGSLPPLDPRTGAV